MPPEPAPVQSGPAEPAATGRDDVAPKSVMFEMPDGVGLWTTRYPPGREAPVGLVVLIHGFSVHSGLYAHVARALVAHGLEVVAFDCRGHGRSGGKRGHVRRFRQFRDDLGRVIDFVRAGRADLPVALMGHSHGGLIALDYVLAGATPSVSALVVAAPFVGFRIRVPLIKRIVAPLLDRLWPAAAFANQLTAEGATRDIAAREMLQTDPLIFRVATPRWYAEVKRAQAEIMQRAATLGVPTFMLLPGDDRVVATEAAEELARRAGERVEIRTYAPLFHELYLEPERDQVLADIASWVVPRVRGSYT